LSASPVTAVPVGRVPALLPYQLARTDKEFLETLANWSTRYHVEPEFGTKDPLQEHRLAGVPDYSTASTASRGDLEVRRRGLLLLLQSAREFLFEDGVETSFSKDLVSLIQRYGNFAVSLLGELALSDVVSDEVISEALRWVGRMSDRRTRWYRLRLLEELLSSRSAKVRDGASLGLVSLDDPHAIPYVQKAFQRERIRDLRRDLQLVLARLQRDR
jgi:hypothetical protein